MNYFSYFLLILKLSLIYASFLNSNSPEQIHLSLGRNLQEIFVTWTTYGSSTKCDDNDNNNSTSLVYYGHEENKLYLKASGFCTKFQDGGPLKRIHFIHRVALSHLEPLTKYYYKCGSDESGWSKIYSFKSLTESTQWSPQLIIYGDLGLENGQSIPRIRKEVTENNTIDLILHVGDLAYDLDSNNSYVGDEFMRIMEPIASRLPYQTCPGNHENQYNFSNYVNRFTMFDMDNFNMNNHFYSFHLGPAKFISFSTEFYYYINYGWAQLLRQYLWLFKTLIEANKPENRAKHPWIITMAHRPMYCSNNDRDDCTHYKSFIRKGYPFIGLGLEDLFKKFNVDLSIWAHEHSYERLWPVYDQNVYNGTSNSNNPYENPGAPVHIITGSAGCKEDIDDFVKNPSIWSAKRIREYGYTKMKIINSTHIYLEQISDNQNGKVIDSITLIKNQPRQPIQIDDDEEKLFLKYFPDISIEN